MLKPKPITPTEEARIRECLELDTNSPSGLTWKVKFRNKSNVGDPAGTLRTKKCGHQNWTVKLDGRLHQAHNIIWLFLSDQWPADLWPLTVDHINRNGSNNSYENLRLATRSQQVSNRRAYGSSSYRYVSWSKQRQKWRASWYHPVTKKLIYVGLFTDELQAHRAALASRLESYDFTTGEWL